MKRMVLILVFIFFCSSAAFSDWYLGGDLYFYNNSLWGEAEIEISPTLGFIVNHKFDWGFNLLFSNAPPYRGSDYYIYDYSTFGIGVFLRYSFIEINKFSLIGNFGLNYLTSRGLVSYQLDDGNWYDWYSYEVYESSLNFHFSPILQYKLLDNLYLYTSLGFVSLAFLSNDWDSWNEYYLNLNTSDISLNNISIGFYILFGSSGRRYKGAEQQNNQTVRSESASGRESGNRGNSRRQDREPDSTPRLGEPTLLQMNLNRLPAVPIAGNNLKFEFGGDTWIARLNGRDFLAGTFSSQETDEGNILTLKQTHAYPPRNIPGIRWVRTPGPEIVLEYKRGPPASLRPHRN